MNNLINESISNHYFLYFKFRAVRLTFSRVLGRRKTFRGYGETQQLLPITDFYWWLRISSDLWVSDAEASHAWCDL